MKNIFRFPLLVGEGKGEVTEIENMI